MYFSDGEQDTEGAAGNVLRMARLGKLAELCFDAHPLLAPAVPLTPRPSRQDEARRERGQPRLI